MAATQTATTSTAPAASPPPEQLRVPPAGDEGHRGYGLRVGRWEALAVLALAAVGFSILGYRMIVVHHVVVFDALDRLARAYFVWHNDPPKLASIGFLFPPFTTLVFLPVAAIKPVASSLVGLPVTTAIFAGGALVAIDRVLARCEMPVRFRLALVVGVAVNPLFAFYASNGMAEAVYLYLLVAGLYGFVSWHTTGEARFLIGSGVAFALALMTRYEFIIWAALVAVLVGAALSAQRRAPDEVEGSVIAFLAPVIYGLTLWVLFNAVIVGDPIGWLTNSSSGLAVNGAGPTGGGAGVPAVAARLLEVLSQTAPVALLAGPALVATFVLQRNRMALWLAAFVALSILLVGADALIQDKEGVVTLQNGLTMLVVGLVGAAWLYRSLEPFRIVIWGATLALLVIGIVLSWQAMKSYPFQNEAQAFVRAIETGKDQEGTNSRGGFQVGIAPERAMAAYVNRTVKRKNSVLTDNAQTFGVMLLSGRPQLFFDRIDKGDQRWRSVLRSPFGRVRYLLVASTARGDLIRRVYSRALNGSDPALTVVFRTERYVLLRVAQNRQAQGFVAPAAAGGGAAP